MARRMYMGFLVAVALAFTGLPALACPDPGDHLLKYSNPVVRLWTDIDRKEAEAVMEDIAFFGDFIDLQFRSCGITPKKSNPIRCYLYGSRDDFTERRRKENVWEQAAAYFSPGNNRIVACFDGGERSARADLMHEVGHQIIRRYFTGPPPWFDEGFACYFQGIEFDPHRNVVSLCNNFSRLVTVRNMIEQGNLIDWEIFFEETEYGLYRERIRRGEVDTRRFYAQSWGVVYFYMQSEDEETEEIRDRFIKGMNTGRERTKLIRTDLVNRKEDFLTFFRQVDEHEVFLLYTASAKHRAEKQYDLALDKLLGILEWHPKHVAALRLAAEVTWEGKKFDTSTEFWKILSGMDLKNTFYLWKLCRCLSETGTVKNDGEILAEAVAAGEEAVRISRKQDPDCLAALAMAYYAAGDVKEALQTMRKATRFKCENRDEYARLEDKYFHEIIEKK